MPRRKHKLYSKPRRLYDKARIEAENLLIKKYGLKSKREIWKADAYVEKIRNRAKAAITKQEEQEKLFEKLEKIGLKVKNMAEALALNKEDILKRRLQSVLMKKNLAKTPRQARQLIVHKHVQIKNKTVNVPSYITKTEEESEITIK